jgi:hypothetical protein
MSVSSGLGLMLAVLIACTLVLAPAIAAKPLPHRQSSTSTYHGTHAASTTLANTVNAATEIDARRAITVAAASNDANEVTCVLAPLNSLHECESARSFLS